MRLNRFRSLRLATAGVFSLALAFGAAPANAVGDLLVAPTRVVLNGSGGTEVVLNNIGSQPATYRITLELRRMNAEGELEDVGEAEASVAEKAGLEMIRYAPRRITLPPDQPQSIRITARPGADLPDGEYRVHMSFRAIPEANPIAAEPQAPVTGVVVQLTPIYGITIPVIVRKGQLEAQAAIANPRVVMTPEGTMLALDMSRSGAKSIYGELAAFAPGVKQPVYSARGVAIYPELKARKLELPLGVDQAAKLRGPLRFEYRETPENGGKLIAAVEAILP
jgi:P pilus assembly chaperone PapD